MIAVGGLGTITHAETQGFQWDANSETDLAGYRLYQDGIQVAEIPAGTETVAIELAEEGEWVFHLTAFDNDNNESGPSNTVRVDTVAPDPPTGFSLWDMIVSWFKRMFGRGLRTV
ncbi:MAG: hypothetical protein GY845_21845 [Planctomycetes bacterium]|nr:hypothetical protein [Planctomycetota bacterium]